MLASSSSSRFGLRLFPWRGTDTLLRCASHRFFCACGRARRSGSRVSGLIDAERPTTWKRDVRERSRALVLHRAAWDVVFFHPGHKRRHVLTHEIELVQIIFIGRMHGDL